jgi:isopenicillin-N epimerase
MLSRRRLLVTGAFATGASAFSNVLAAEKQPQPPVTANSLQDWNAVRRQFELDPKYIHLSLFFLASHPRPVREEIEKYRQQLQANPLITAERMVFGPKGDLVGSRAEEVCGAISTYIAGTDNEKDNIALTQNTTMGLALLYQGLLLKEGDEVLTTMHDHFVHHEAIRLATDRSHATMKKIPLFDAHDQVSADEMADRVRKAIGPKTRAVGLTWVLSSTGLKLPIRRFADVIAEVNRQRGEENRVLLIVDGVHGLGVEDPNIVAMGMDAFAAGTHKWVFGPRGTGFVWAKSDVWKKLRPMIPSMQDMALYDAWVAGKAPSSPPRAAWFSPGGFQAFDHFWALPAAFKFHRDIGPMRISDRIHHLNAQVREGLSNKKTMGHVTVYTPPTRELSSGMVCFSVKRLDAQEVVRRLFEKGILASTTPYADSYARVGFGIQNTDEEVEKTLVAIRELGQPSPTISMKLQKNPDTASAMASNPQSTAAGGPVFSRSRRSW